MRIPIQPIVLWLILTLTLAGCAAPEGHAVQRRTEPQAAPPPALETPVPTAPSEPPTPEPRYTLTDEERLTIEQIVMNEARGEPYEGQMMIAQCVLDGMERNSLDLAGYMEAYGTAAYTKEEPYDGVKEAVSAVFDDGERVTEAKADLWYAYKNSTSTWHENQQYVTTICCHKFFWCSRNVA